MRIGAGLVDYVLILVYFAVVLLVGVAARRRVSSSLDFLLSGRSLPAWITGLAFISANLGAVEVIGMSANGAEYGMPTMHYYWIGAVPAMLFLGVVMMPFYYGSKVRSVPEFMRRRFGPGAHLVNAITFALAQVLIAGINLFLLATVVNGLLGWPLWVALILAAVIVLSYITLGGLSAAIYNEVLQFFVIVAALLPLTLIGLHRVGGCQARLIDRIQDPGTAALVAGHRAGRPCRPPTVLSVIGIVFGLGIVLLLRLLDHQLRRGPAGHGDQLDDAARSTPIIASFPKMFIPFIVVIHGMIAGVLVPDGDAAEGRRSGRGVTYNDSILSADPRHARPPGCYGLAPDGPAGGVHGGHGGQHLRLQHRPSATTCRQQYVVKGRSDGYYLKVGRWATVGADGAGHRHRVSSPPATAT
ncbi:hypothetical protein GCM10020220_029810 [Nonomuraea rubra]|uniref:sodium:solute symporter family transporter n=1 Tax=Nonomuraea rubra TaxID=46180 RepID=UPI0031EF171E